jgi:hypothetical protein
LQRQGGKHQPLQFSYAALSRNHSRVDINPGSREGIDYILLLGV